MNFSFSEEQEMLREQARSLLADRNSPERVVELATSDEGWDPGLWKELAALGWTGLSLPEEAGGSGMTFVDEAVLFEELGFALYPGPFFSTVALCLPAIRDDEELAGRVASGDAAPTLAWAERGAPFIEWPGDDVEAVESGGGWSLTGEKILVPDLNCATDALVVARTGAGPGIWALGLDDDGVEATVLETMDTTRRLGRLRLSGAAGRLVLEPGNAEDVLKETSVRALAALALEGVGVAQKVLDLAIDYSKERKQFDKPIGSYQAVSHQVANAYVDTELARSLAYWAAWCVAEDSEQAKRAVPAAKSFAGEAAVAASERSIQAHGGIGFTWEHILHRYYKRAEWIDSWAGFGSRHRADLSESILA